MSLWLVPVFLGGGTTTWLGFLFIGALMMRRAWLVAAGVYAVLSFIVSIGLFSSLGAALQIGLIIVGTIHALVANRRWMLTAWGRKERGTKMFGRVLPGATSTPPVSRPDTAAPPIPVASAPAPAASVAEPTHQELLEAGMLSVDEDPRITGFDPASIELPDPTAQPSPVVPNQPVIPNAPDTQWRPLSPNVAAPLTSVPSSFATPSPFTGLQMTQLPSSSTVLPPRDAVDPMTAGLEALSAIPAIGPERAARLIKARENLPLDSLQAVADAAGLQGFELVRIRPFLRFPLG